MRETRYHSTELELRSSADGGTLQLRGYASIFNQPYQVGWFTESVAPTAFNKTAREADVRALFNHDPNYPLGRVKAGTLRIVPDDQGLYYEVNLPGSDVGRRVAEAVERGDVTGSSFSFSVVRERWNETGDERELLEVKLYDVGPVTFPANEATSVDLVVPMRSLARATGLDLAEVRSAIDAGTLSDLLLEHRVWEKVGHEIRHRVREPEQFEEGSFRTKDIPLQTGDGVTELMAKNVYCVFGRLKQDEDNHKAGSMALQAMRFRVEVQQGEEWVPTGWTLEKAKAWWAKHGDSFRHLNVTAEVTTDAAAGEPDTKSTHSTAQPEPVRARLWAVRLRSAYDMLTTGVDK